MKHFEHNRKTDRTDAVRLVEISAEQASESPPSWESMYLAAKRHYQDYGSLDVPDRFPCQDGVCLGAWLAQQRRIRAGLAEGVLTEEQIMALDGIGMTWDVSDYVFERNYSAAAVYYREHGDLECKPDYVDSSGVKLGAWLVYLRSQYKKRGRFLLTAEQFRMLDEIGRGTSTYDGLSIAWSVIEHISNKKYLGAKTLFATHYHELTELEGKIDNVSNYCVAVKEKGDDIVFLRKIIKGGADKSYGIQVAKLAGLPDIVIDRAKELLEQLTDSDITEKIQRIETKAGAAPQKAAKVKHYDDVDLGQMSLFETVSDEDVLKELESIDISNLTPLDALNTLYRLQTELKNRWKG